MTALTADRDTPERAGKGFSNDVAASTEIFAGSLVVLDTSGNAEPGTTATGKVAAGRAKTYVDNSSGAAGDKTIVIEPGTFKWANGDSITKANIGDAAYIVDDQTVSKGSSGKSQAGIIVGVDSDGVWVETKAPYITSTGLLAANNLSDVGSVATARSNLGLDTGDSPTFAALTVTGVMTGLQKTQVVAANAYSVTDADGDIVIFANDDTDVVTLQAVAASNLGQRVTVICGAADGGALVSVSPNSADAIYGTVAGVSFSGTDDKDAQLTKVTQNKGDYIVLVSDGSTGWFVAGGVGVWASEA